MNASQRAVGSTAPPKKLHIAQNRRIIASMQEIFALITAAGHLTNVAKTAFQTHSKVETDAARIELGEAIIELQSKIAALQTSYQSIWESNEALKKQLASFEKWDEESARYSLISVGGDGACAYEPKHEVPGEAPHWLCPTCFEDRRKSILQPRNLMGNYKCPKCGTEVLATKAFPASETKTNRLSTEAEQMLQRYVGAERGISLQEAIQGMGLSTGKADFLFDQLLKRKFVRLAGGRAGGPITHCGTPDGREYLNKVGLLK